MTQADDAPLLEFVSVTKGYPSPTGGDPVLVLHELELTVTSGEALAITGPSGSGKSTLLHLAGALDQPDSGRITIAGEDLGVMSETAAAILRARHIGFIFQAHHLLPQLSVLENILLPTLAKAAGDDLRSGAAERAMALLRRVGLETRAGHRPGELSGGESQRAAVARALINRPRLVLADEPTGALDRDTAAVLGDLLVEINHEQGAALLVVTHSAELARRMNRHLELRHGQLTP